MTSTCFTFSIKSISTVAIHASKRTSHAIDPSTSSSSPLCTNFGQHPIKSCRTWTPIPFPNISNFSTPLSSYVKNTCYSPTRSSGHSLFNKVLWFIKSNILSRETSLHHGTTKWPIHLRTSPFPEHAFGIPDLHSVTLLPIWSTNVFELHWLPRLSYTCFSKKLPLGSRFLVQTIASNNHWGHDNWVASSIHISLPHVCRTMKCTDKYMYFAKH